MNVDKQIIQAITDEKLDIALTLAVSNPFTSKALKTAATKCHFELLWNLYQVARSKGIDLSSFILKDVIAKGRVDVVEFLYGEKELDLTLRWDSSHKTVLMQACQYDQRDIVERLLNYGADPEQRDLRGRNAFFYSLLCSDVNIFRLLFLRTGKIDYVNDLGRNLLHGVCSYGTSKEIFDEILNLNAIDVNVQDENGDTPLHVAIMWNFDLRNSPFSKYRAQKLIKHPAIDLRITNHQGETVLKQSRELGSPFIRLIEEVLAAKES